jgi:uncharacterized protein YegP (UPF0339 family)
VWVASVPGPGTGDTHPRRGGPPAPGRPVRAQEGQAGGYHFNLVASNGEVVATSESYRSKAGALNGIGSVQRHAAGAASTTKPAASLTAHYFASDGGRRPGETLVGMAVSA